MDEPDALSSFIIEKVASSWFDIFELMLLLSSAVKECTRFTMS